MSTDIYTRRLIVTLPDVSGEEADTIASECGYRWNPRDPSSVLVGRHIADEAERLGVQIDVPGWLR